MPTWIKAPNIVALFNSVNKIAPVRDKASDGTIGDIAHQSGTSGHNPDDYPGVKAERTDSDNIAEVRAGDVDRDLNIASIAGDDMETVVQAILKSADKNRLIYIIYKRRIWEKSNGWKQRTYTGINAHSEHAHFSGDPASDNDSRPWASIESLVSGGVSELFCKQGDTGQNVTYLQYRLRNLGFDVGTVDGDFGAKTTAALLKACKAQYASYSGNGKSYGAAEMIYLDALWVKKVGGDDALVKRIAELEAKVNNTAPQPEAGITFPMTVVFNGTINKA